MSDKKTLDKSKPFGTVSGPGVTHRYEQDGKKFTGQRVEIKETPLPKTKRGTKK